MAVASERNAPWPFHDVSRVVCSFLLPLDVAKLHTVSQSVRGCIDARDLLWQQIRDRVSAFADRAGRGRPSLPLPPWMVLNSNVLTWALGYRYNRDPPAFPAYDIAVKEEDIARAIHWIKSHFTWMVNREVVVLSVSYVEPLRFAVPGSGGDPWRSNCYSVGPRISRLRTDEDLIAWTAVWFFGFHGEEYKVWETEMKNSPYEREVKRIRSGAEFNEPK